MDASSVNTAFRRWSEASRRSLLGLGVASGLASLLGLAEAAAKKKKRKKKKKHKKRCGGGACVPLVCGNGGACRVFVTSTTHNGNLGGLLGADAICQTRAAAAGLSGTYKAWLSDTFQSPATRLAHSTGPYQLVNGVTVANNWNDLTDGVLSAAIQVTETGNIVNQPQQWVWTNTTGNGTIFVASAPDCCLNWTTSDGSDSGYHGVVIPDQANDAWTIVGGLDCALVARLYCFQQS